MRDKLTIKELKDLKKALVDSYRVSYDSGYYCGKLSNKLAEAEKELEATEDYLNSLPGDNRLRVFSIRNVLKKIREKDEPQNNPIKNDEEETKT